MHASRKLAALLLMVAFVFACSDGPGGSVVPHQSVNGPHGRQHSKSPRGLGSRRARSRRRPRCLLQPRGKLLGE